MDKFRYLFAIAFGAYVFILLPSSFAGSDRTGVYFFGDSHVTGRFGSELDKRLWEWTSSWSDGESGDGSGVSSDQSHNWREVHSVGVCGATPQYFISKSKTKCGFWQKDSVDGSLSDSDGKVQSSGVAPSVKVELSRLNPHFIVIELGANLYPEENWASKEIQIKRLIEVIASQNKVASLKCLWVGPPNGRNKPEPKLQKLVDLIKSNLGDTCTFFDSRTVTTYPETGGDGAHYSGFPEAKAIVDGWVKAVMDVVVGGG